VGSDALQPAGGYSKAPAVDVAAEGGDRPADLVVKAGAIHSMAAARETNASVHRAMAVRAGRIVALSRDLGGVDDLVGRDTVVIDELGLTVLPTFDDTHTHLIFAGRAANDLQVADAHDLAEFLGLIRRQAASTPAGQWIRTASNWHELQLAERRLPTCAELDSAAPDNPVLVKRGGHNDVVNSLALRLAGITADTPAPEEGGVIEHDAQGELTGRLEDSAIALVEGLLPAPTFDEQIAGLRLASAGYAATGIGAVRDAAVNANEVALLQAARDHDALAVRTQAMVIIGFAGPKPVMDDFLDQLDADGTRPGAGDGQLRLWGLKFVADGGVENAALDQPYASREDYRGELQWEADELADAVRRAVQRGWKVGVHAWGDRAVRTTLDAFEAVLEAEPGTAPGSLVLEHAGLARPDQRARAIRLGIPVTVQHPLLYGLAAALAECWGRARTEDIFPLREWLDEGAFLSAGSDYPNGKYDAMGSMWGMATRQSPIGVLGPRHAISRYEAARLHTADAARFVGDGDIRGTLAPGMLADFAAYRADPLTCPVDQLPDLLPALAVIGGRARHDPDGLIGDDTPAVRPRTGRPGVPAGPLRCC
jgi:predicted amidohydrolase YtcJ